MTDGLQKNHSLMQAAMLAYPKQTLMETEMSVQALEPASGPLEQSRLARSVLPILAYRIRKAFFAQLLVILVYRINEHCRGFVAQIMAALDETRRREAARIIRRYRHLIDNDKCSDLPSKAHNPPNLRRVAL